jgi:hypothetical protein
MDERLAKVEVTNSKEVKALGARLKDELITNFKKSALGDEQELKTFYAELDKKFEEKFRIFKEKMKDDLKVPSIRRQNFSFLFHRQTTKSISKINSVTCEHVLRMENSRASMNSKRNSRM